MGMTARWLSPEWLSPELLAGAGSGLLHLLLLGWIGPWAPLTPEPEPVAIALVIEEPPEAREAREKIQIPRRVRRPHPLLRLARPPPTPAPPLKPPEEKPEEKPVEKPEEKRIVTPPPEEKEKEQKKEPQPEESAQKGVVAGDRLADKKPEELKFVRSDAEGGKISLSTSAISDRNHIELEETRAPTSTARGLGDGSTAEDRIVLHPDRYSAKKEVKTGLKKGQRTRRQQAAATAVRGGGERPAAGAAPETVRLPEVIPAEAGGDDPSEAGGDDPAGAAQEAQGAAQEAAAGGLTIWIEPAPPPVPVVRRPVRQAEEQAPVQAVPIPAPVQAPVAAEPERPLFFGDDFMNAWSSPELSGSATTASGEDVPTELADQTPDRTSSAGASFASLEVADLRLPEGRRTQISTRRDPMGVWATDLDQQLREGMVYPPELKALGVYGVVVVGFRVQPDGRITDVRIISSDVPELVVPAVQSIPERTGPLPQERERSYRRGIELRYTFRFGSAPSG